jgi:hypothetical protein
MMYFVGSRPASYVRNAGCEIGNITGAACNGASITVYQRPPTDTTA